MPKLSPLGSRNMPPYMIRGLADVVKIMKLRWRNYPGFSSWDQPDRTSPSKQRTFPAPRQRGTWLQKKGQREEIVTGFAYRLGATSQGIGLEMENKKFSQVTP